MRVGRCTRRERWGEVTQAGDKSPFIHFLPLQPLPPALGPRSSGPSMLGTSLSEDPGSAWGCQEHSQAWLA